MQRPCTRRVLLPSVQTPRPLLAGTLVRWGKPGAGPQHALGVTPACHQGFTTTPWHPSCSGKAAVTRPAPLQRRCYDGWGAGGTVQSQPHLEGKVLFLGTNSKYLAPLCLLFSLSFRLGRLLLSLGLPFSCWWGLPSTCFCLRQLLFLLFLFTQEFPDVFWKPLLAPQVVILQGDQNATAGSVSLPCRGLSSSHSRPPFCPFSSAYLATLVCPRAPAGSTQEPVYSKRELSDSWENRQAWSEASLQPATTHSLQQPVSGTFPLLSIVLAMKSTVMG